MEQKKIDRISQLSRLSRERELTEEEKQEQQLLRREYIDSMKNNLHATLQNVVIQHPDGSRRKEGAVPMKNVDKYSRNYFAPEQTEYQWMHREYVDTAPRWCSVDLRDGNQSLVVPMDLEKKKALFLFLCRMGFREIEVGFPAASDTE